jgi:hypothetical protein
MPSLTVDLSRAQEVFERAVSLAESGQPLPEEWLERTRRVAAAPSRTFTAMLGTAILARACDSRVDPVALKTTHEPPHGLWAYSARGVAKDALVPLSREWGVDIGTRGAEPLNNQPFFRYRSVHRGMAVRPHVRPHLDYLVETLERMRELTPTEIQHALAAFVAVRRRKARRPLPRMVIATDQWSILDFLVAVEAFVTQYPEEGRRGQALVAAALDLSYQVVELGHVNDPSRRTPGDVIPLDDVGTPTSSYEVKQRPASPGEVRGWADRLARAQLSRGTYVLLAPQSNREMFEYLADEILLEKSVVIELVFGVQEFLKRCILTSPLTVERFMSEFPRRMLERLAEADVAATTLQEWAELFG